MENSNIRFQGDPMVMSLAENSCFKFIRFNLILSHFFLILSYGKSEKKATKNRLKQAEKCHKIELALDLRFLHKHPIKG